MIELKEQMVSQSIQFQKLLKFFIDAVMNYSFFPIRLMSFAGFLFSSIGFISGIWILISRLAYGPGKLGDGLP